MAQFAVEGDAAMSDQSIARPIARTVDLQTALPWLAAAAVYLLLMLLGPQLLSDPDSYSHIALGRWMLAHHAVPMADPFSQTMQGKPWIAFEWLSQVLLAGAYALGGWVAVIALTAAATGLAFALLARFVGREWKPLPTLMLLLMSLVLLSPHILARPHMLALPVMIGWVAALVRAVDDKRAPSWWLLLLMMLWANLHGSFTLGLAIIAPIAFDAVCNADRAGRWRVAQRWFLFGIAAFAAASLNPYGPEMILVTFHTIALGQALHVITEWQPQNFARLGAFEIIMLGGFGLALLRGIKLPPLRILMLLWLLHLSLAQSRHADLLGMLAPFFLVHPLAGQLGVRATGRGDTRIAAWLPAAAVVLLIAVTGSVIARNDIHPPARITPVKALKAIDPAKAGPILNDYDFGAYLDFVGVAPFIDGRTELYGADFVLRYDRALGLQDLPGFLKLLDQYRFGATLLAPSTPAVALLDRLPEWHRVYADDIAVVHVRRGVNPAKAR